MDTSEALLDRRADAPLPQGRQVQQGGDHAMRARRNPDAFWRLRHDDLAALLARRDLAWETVRVYLALADLTCGYGKDRDTVSLGQIAEHAGMFTPAADGEQRPEVRHVRRALKTLEALGLYGQAPAEGQDVTRWVVWPPTTPEAPSTTAGTGSSASGGTTAEAGSSTTANPTADAGSRTTAKTTAGAGRHQDIQEKEDIQEGEEDDCPPPSVASLSQEKDSGNGTATANGHRETEGIQGNEHGTTTDPDEALRLALGRPPTPKELITFRQAVGEAQAAGATDALIARFVRLAAPGEGVWAGPNAAREEAKRLVDSWAKAGLEPRRQSVLEIIKDVWSAWGYVQQKGLPSWDMGLARNRKVLAWARREASALRAAGGKDDHD